MSAHVHTWRRIVLNPASPHPTDGPSAVDWRMWPEGMTKQVCDCGEVGFEVPIDALDEETERRIAERADA